MNEKSEAYYMDKEGSHFISHRSLCDYHSSSDVEKATL